MIEFFLPTNFYTSQADRWLQKALEVPKYNHHLGLGKAAIPPEFFEQDPSTKKLFKLFDDVQPRFFKTPPGHIFNWHTDPLPNRQCVLNLCLTPAIGRTYFLENTTIHVKWCKLVELKYEECRWYLLNTSKTHCFLNDNTSDRYVISADLNYITYENALKKIQNEYNTVN